MLRATTVCRPSGTTNHWQNTVFRDFPTFSRICIFFLLTLSLPLFSLLIFLFSLPLPYSAFHLSILSDVTKGSSRGATLSFTLRSKGEGGQPRYLILQEIASHFSSPPPPPHLPRTLRADSKYCNLQYFCSFRIKKPHFATW